MNITVYVAKGIEAELRRRARRARQTPSLYVQSLLRDALSDEPARFSDGFAALAGSWQDDRDAAAILADIAAKRTPAKRASLR